MEDYDVAATRFVEDLFMHVYHGVEERKKEAIFFVNNYLDEDGVPKKPTLIYEYVSRPTRLVLNRPIYNHYQDLMGSKLGDFMRDNYSVRVLHIQKWQLGEDGMLGFMEGLMFNTTLVTLDLANNELGADGMKVLGIYIVKNQNLKHLMLNHNRLRDPGIKNLTEKIDQSNLISLNIAYNDLTQVGLDPFLMILNSTKITALYLWGNVFGLETWSIYKGLLDQKSIRYTDTLLQKVDDQCCIVKNSQVRDTNFWYDVPPVLERGLVVPPGFVDKPHRHSASVEQKPRITPVSDHENYYDDDDFEEFPNFSLN